MKLSKIILLAATFCLISSSGYSETTLEWWQFWTDPSIKPVIQEIVADFEQQNPEIKVNLTDLTWSNGHEKIVIAMASNTAPDILELGSDWIAQFADKGHLADISSDIAGDSAGVRGWSLAEYNDKIYAHPWFLGTRVIFWNRDLVEKAVDSLPFVPVTFTDIYSAALKVNELGKDIYGWGSNSPEKHRLYKKFMPFFWSSGGQLFSDDGKYCVLASIYGVDALTQYKQLHDSCGFLGNQRAIEDAFLDGKVG
ncbi:MAG: extracellular solute-binding protein, partial [bacterium]|nr:extracellular solute-binding protein [bacterium]